MSVKMVVAVTDSDWFDFVRLQHEPEELNFWSPSARSFRALEQGELFLFKLHSPRNFIVGGGIFAYANDLPCSLAWQAFGALNGAPSLDEMRQRIAKYRRERDDGSDFVIGCRVLTQPFFLPESQWIPVPETWAPNIVSFKTFDTKNADGLGLWESVQAAQSATNYGQGFEATSGPRYGQPTLVKPRLGQGAFRILVTDTYSRRCAVSGEKTLPALEAAHIRPYSKGGEHIASNGLLLRRDIHSLFDAGYVTVTPDMKFEVSSRIREEFDNGKHYYALHGASVAMPDNIAHRPNKDALDWHNTVKFNRRPWNEKGRA